MGSAYQIQDQGKPYFLTFQVVGWVDIFTRKDYRDLLIESLKYCIQHKGLELFAYVIMSNHVHAIMRSKDGNLSSIVRDFKTHTSKQILRSALTNPLESRRGWLKVVFEYHAKFNKRNDSLQFWTHENHAVELSTNDLLDSRMEYIHQNPVRAGWVENPEDYLYSSARNYTGLSSLLEIDLV